MKMIVLGGFGSDAGYWSFEGGRWVHHGGWEIDQLVDVSRSLSILGQAAKLKTPGLAETVSKELGVNLEKALTAHLRSQLGSGAVVIVNAVGA